MGCGYVAYVAGDLGVSVARLLGEDNGQGLGKEKVREELREVGGGGGGSIPLSAASFQFRADFSLVW